MREHMTYEEWWKKYGSQIDKSVEDIAAEAYLVGQANERQRAAKIARDHGKSVGCLCGHFDVCPHVDQIDVAFEIAKEIVHGKKIR